MAMTTCKECGEKYSGDSLICLHCEDPTGAVTKKKSTDREKAAIQGFAGLLVIIFLLVGIARCSSDDKPAQATQNEAVIPAQASPNDAGTKKILDLLKPEDIVKFPQSNVACITKEGLGQFMEYGLKGENTKLKSMMIDSGSGEAQCMMLSSSLKYRVIHVEYNDPEHPDFGVAEIVGVKIKSASQGAWVMTIFAERAK